MKNYSKALNSRDYNYNFALANCSFEDNMQKIIKYIYNQNKVNISRIITENSYLSQSSELFIRELSVSMRDQIIYYKMQNNLLKKYEELDFFTKLVVNSKDEAEKKLKNSNEANQTLQIKYDQLKQKYNQVVNSKGWKMLEKLRKIIYKFKIRGKK